MHEAFFYNKLENYKVQCLLCPRECIIEEEKFGNCHARRNRKGTLSSEVFGQISAFNMDPIEKKPLYHFLPGREILSIGTIGCNLHCIFCQNYTLSQCSTLRPALVKKVSPEELCNIVIKTKNNVGLAFTYNEPTINYEFMLDTARLVKKEGRYTVMISNGYINPDPLEMLLGCIDAFNIDLKGFTETFYKKYSKATLQPVLKTIKHIAKKGKHVELTNLVIPAANDNETDFEAMCRWIADEVGKNTVLHLSRYFPRYELNQYPTPPATLFNLYDIAKTYLNYVYVGNMATEIHSNTVCPNCGKTVIERTYFHVNKVGIDNSGNCKTCGYNIIKYV